MLNLDEAIKAIESIGDRIDLLVNNAAFTFHNDNVLDITEDEINKYVQSVICLLTVLEENSIIGQIEGEKLWYFGTIQIRLFV